MTKSEKATAISTRFHFNQLNGNELQIYQLLTEQPNYTTLHHIQLGKHVRQQYDGYFTNELVNSIDELANDILTTMEG